MQHDQIDTLLLSKGLDHFRLNFIYVMMCMLVYDGSGSMKCVELTKVGFEEICLFEFYIFINEDFRRLSTSLCRPKTGDNSVLRFVLRLHCAT